VTKGNNFFKDDTFVFEGSSYTAAIHRKKEHGRFLDGMCPAAGR